MSGENQEIKNEVAQVNLKVVNKDGNEVFFKVKRTTAMKKLMDAYCKKSGLERNRVRFLYDGKILEDEKTPEDYEMDDDDLIDLVEEQIGGAGGVF